MRHTIQMDSLQTHLFPADDLEMGSIVRGHIDSMPSYSGHFLRTYLGLVLLEEPFRTWGNESLSQTHIRGTFIPAGAKLTIIVGGEDPE